MKVWIRKVVGGQEPSCGTTKRKNAKTIFNAKFVKINPLAIY